MATETYKIHIKNFDGPFDLLLFFIERDELDIHDIPIAQITHDFLSFIEEAEQLNINLASEFILVAANLIRIKARMIIPRKELDEEGNELDPREELVQKLLEYKQFKEVLSDLGKLEDAQLYRRPRGNVDGELKHLAQKALLESEWESLTLAGLLKSFRRIMENMEKRNQRVSHRIFYVPFTIEQMQEQIFSRLEVHDRINFENAFEDCSTRIHALITFLAILELLNMQKLYLINGEKPNQFWLERAEEADSGEEE